MITPSKIPKNAPKKLKYLSFFILVVPKVFKLKKTYCLEISFEKGYSAIFKKPNLFTKEMIFSARSLAALEKKVIDFHREAESIRDNISMSLIEQFVQDIKVRIARRVPKYQTESPYSYEDYAEQYEELF